jgi:hypothetical protein
LLRIEGAILAALLAPIVACQSVPVLPPLDPEEQALVDSAPIGRLSASITGCPAPAPEFESVCHEELRELETLLVATGLFTSFEEDPALADVTVTLIPSPGRSFWDTPAANPAAALLSLAIPVWWTDSFGQQLLVEQPATGRLARIDMRREGTRIMWSLAPLWNLGSGRMAAPDPNREASHLRVRILRFLADGAPAAPPPR